MNKPVKPQKQLAVRFSDADAYTNAQLASEYGITNYAAVKNLIRLGYQALQQGSPLVGVDTTQKSEPSGLGDEAKMQLESLLIIALETLALSRISAEKADENALDLARDRAKVMFEKMLGDVQKRGN